MADLTLVVESDPMAVRHALIALQEAALMQGFDADQRGRIEIVLGEALNNIVEHAYAGKVGKILLELSLRPEGMLCLLRDSGAPLPDLQLPPGRLVAFDDCDLPEGGFGWFLIRTLTADLCYRRDADQNELCFLVPGNPPN